MSTTFTHPDYHTPITLPAGLTQDQVLQFQPFQVRSPPPSPTAPTNPPQSWLQTLHRSLTTQSSPSHPFHTNPYTLHSITIQSHDLFGPRIGFLKLTCSVTTTSTSSPAEWLPGAVFLRGPSVAMLVILSPDDDPSERHVLLTVQPRIAAGSLAFVELPAGMVDDASQTFAGQAAREIKEELGMEIAVEGLACLTDLAADAAAEEDGEEGLPRGVYPSPGACDEYIGVYAYERSVPREELGGWTGRLTGLREEGEKITLRLVRMDEVWKVAGRDGKTLAAVALWEGLKREGRI